MGKIGTSGTKSYGSKSYPDKNTDAAFAEIVRIAEAASREAESAGGGYADEEAEAVNSLGCRILAVPARLYEKATEVAARTNPVNAPVPELLPAGVIEPQRLTILATKYWGPAPRQFTVSFMESTPADLRARIISHLNAWSQATNKSFVETSGVGEVRISRGRGGFSSFVGTDILLIPPSRRTMNLEGFTMNTPESEFRRVIRHEAGHTLGFPHEHMRRELVARIDPAKAYPFFRATQGWSKEEVDQQVLTSLDDRTIFGTPADQDSIMCYQLPGNITFDGRPIRGGTDINAMDFAFASLIYPKELSALGATSVAAAGLVFEEDWSPSEDVDVLI